MVPVVRYRGLLAFGLAFTYACGDRPQAHPPSPSPAQVAHSAGADTGVTPVATADLTSLHPPVEGDGWAIIDGECVVTATPSCPESHLAAPAPAPPGAQACVTHEDCQADAFCGAGTCRPHAGTMVTLCLEEVWYEGAADAPPDGQMVLVDADLCVNCPYENYDVNSVRSSIPSTPGVGCRIAGRRCERFPGHVTLTNHPIGDFGPHLTDGDESCDLYTKANEAPGHELQPAVPLAALVGQGCTRLTVGSYDASAGEHSAWVSVWYP
jgi:hypothetical protein